MRVLPQVRFEAQRRPTRLHPLQLVVAGPLGTRTFLLLCQLLVKLGVNLKEFIFCLLFSYLLIFTRLSLLTLTLFILTLPFLLSNKLLILLWLLILLEHLGLRLLRLLLCLSEQSIEFTPDSVVHLLANWDESRGFSHQDYYVISIVHSGQECASV